MTSQRNRSCQKILAELQSEVEALRWTTADEMKSKTREIEQAKQEVQRIQAEREESLECQRVELTDLYEKMLQDREDAFRKQEENICQQVQILEKRFQSLTNENSRLKSDCAQLQRACEKLSTDICRKDEKCNQLTWQVDDYCRKLQETEDSLQKKVQQLESENQNNQNLIDQMALDHKREMDKVLLNANSSHDFSFLNVFIFR